MPFASGRFCRALRTLNYPCLEEFGHFLFPPGSLFGAQRTWWGNQGPRRVPHEGVDLSRYVRTDGQPAFLEPGTVLPPLAAGRIMRIIADFLGQTVFVAHAQHTLQDKILFSVYGHVEPRFKADDVVREEEGLALLACPPATSSVPPHLHLSILWLPARYPKERLDWQSLTTPSTFPSFCDPLPFLRRR